MAWLTSKQSSQYDKALAIFVVAWEQRKLGELADIVGGGTPNTNNPEYWDGDIDWLRLPKWKVNDMLLAA